MPRNMMVGWKNALLPVYQAKPGADPGGGPGGPGPPDHQK